MNMPLLPTIPKFHVRRFYVCSEFSCGALQYEDIMPFSMVPRLPSRCGHHKFKLYRISKKKFAEIVARKDARKADI